MRKQNMIYKSQFRLHLVIYKKNIIVPKFITAVNPLLNPFLLVKNDTKT